ncbi:MAG: DUF4215 domain-containing protein [Acidobacteriia bacterium]|nr:DUF4215 domain-containing protein [Terriglobia bacterium]
MNQQASPFPPPTGRISTILLMLLLLATPAGAAQYTVTTTRDKNDGACTPADCSLREAISAANATPETDEINVPAGTYVLKQGELGISGDLSLVGDGPDTTVIDGNRESWVFAITNGNVSISAVTIRNGKGRDFGGGIFDNGSGNLTLTNCTLSDNSASGEGGAIFNEYGTLVLTSCTLSGNSAFYGGAIRSYYATSKLTNCTLSGNSAAYGAAIYNVGGAATLTNCTLSVNSANVDGGGIYNEYGGTATVASSVLAGNSAIYSRNCFGSGITSGGYNLTDDGSCGLTGTGDREDVNPRLGPLANNGGRTQTHALLAGSPAIDGVTDPTACAVTTDQRGAARPADGDGVGGARCDIGAYELGATLPRCGNGVVDAGEECDDGNLNPRDGCTNACTLCGNGAIRAPEECDDANRQSNDGCDSACHRERCGDGTRQIGEECDDGNLVNGDGCDANCRPSGCGNGAQSAGEECDDGNLVDGDGCDSNCRPTGCGNGVQTTGEECDDGNTMSEDGCDSRCRREFCRDGIRQVGLGEQCDDGNSVDGDGCDSNCTPTGCGNGVQTAGEECDDGNTTNGDGCDANCTVTGCGNGIVTAGEACDDGNSVNGDGCDANCTVTGCGNGIRTGSEECDDGNHNPFDGCTAACKRCGNGIVTPPEECDDGNTDPADGCTTACTLCGNGIITLPEQCDDGNSISGDACSATCTTAPGCGNAIREGDEECDDGGVCSGGADEGSYCSGPGQCSGGECQAVGGDGCAANCTLEQAVTVHVVPGVVEDGGLRAGTSGVVVDFGYLFKVPLPFATAHMTLRVGRLRGTAQADGIPLAARVADVSFGPIPISYFGCVCVEALEDPALGEGVAGVGSVTCTGTRPGVDLTASIDHNTNNVDPQCTAGVVEKAGQCEYAMCTDGSYPGRACRDDLDCGGPHAGVCNGPETITPTGSGPVGSARLDLRLLTRHFDSCSVETSSKICVGAKNAGAECGSDGDCPGGRCVPAKGEDGVPCTADDPVPGASRMEPYFGALLPLDLRAVLTTGVATAEILDANNDAGYRLAGEATGLPLRCDALAHGGFDGTLVAGAPGLHVTSGLGDAVTAFVLAFRLCGNRVLDAGEDCDTGGESATCNDDCTLAVCGDGMVNRSSGEQCDDGNRNDNDECRNDCRPNVCGDGVIRTGAEQCDDGNITDGDGCDSNCTPTACGNGILTAGEQCDDGNTVSEDGCSSGCRIERCGDGVRQAALGEQCDDGNALNGDGCDVNCTVSACGNSIIAASEQCDDGNTANGDCCSSACRFESVGVPCFDGDVCDGAGSCDGSGWCDRSTDTPLECEDTNPETLDFCDPAHGCQHIRPRVCTGDCNRSGSVTIDELITMVNVALEIAPVSSCDAGDANADGVMTIDEIITAVNQALSGCRFPPTPTASPARRRLAATPTPTARPAPTATLTTQNGRRWKPSEGRR